MNLDRTNFRRPAPLLASLALALALLPVATVRAQADGPPAADAAADNVEVREWVVLISDAHNPRANAVETLGGTLPALFDPLRPGAAGDAARQPSPIGVVRFVGPVSPSRSFTVRLSAPSDAVFYTAWPRAHVKSTEVLWEYLYLANAPPPNSLVALDPAHWLTPLREPALPYVTRGGQAERFLLYDVEVPYTLPLRLEAGKTPDDPVVVGIVEGPPIHDLVLYRPPRESSGGGWTSGHRDAVRSRAPEVLATQPAEVQTVRFAPAGTDPAKFLAADWKARLAPFDLQPADMDLILRLLRAHAIDDQQTTAVFRLDDDELNRLLTLEVTPRPARVRRLALVIARNIDPDLAQIIDGLIAQLGDADWNKREAASNMLVKYIPAANNKLRQAVRSPDPEIAMRAERLLEQRLTR